VKLFLVERTDGCDYDEHDAAVIRAGSKEEIVAKLFTLTEIGLEQLSYYVKHGGNTAEENVGYLLMRGYNIYGLVGFTRENTKITELTDYGELGVVLSSFNAG
jgi:hypothetical protein